MNRSGASRVRTLSVRGSRQFSARFARTLRTATWGFTLIEMLVVVAIIALLLAILLQSLASARASSRTSVCRSNLRQAFLACRMYADAHRGYGPAIGEPYSTLPNWGLAVQKYTGRSQSNSVSLFNSESVLVCPAARAHYGEAMTRTYAMNATGHAGQPGDPDTYDDPGQPAHIHFDRVRSPADTILLFDSARAPISGGAPPSPRTASMVDFRQLAHVKDRLGRFHAAREAFNAVAFDGSCNGYRRIHPGWEKPLP